jgi:hypothetical protein
MGPSCHSNGCGDRVKSERVRARRMSDSDPVRHHGPECGSTGGGGRPRSFPSGPLVSLVGGRPGAEPRLPPAFHRWRQDLSRSTLGRTPRTVLAPRARLLGHRRTSKPRLFLPSQEAEGAEPGKPRAPSPEAEDVGAIARRASEASPGAGGPPPSSRAGASGARARAGRESGGASGGRPLRAARRGGARALPRPPGA